MQPFRWFPPPRFSLQCAHGPQTVVRESPIDLVTPVNHESLTCGPQRGQPTGQERTAGAKGDLTSTDPRQCELSCRRANVPNSPLAVDSRRPSTSRSAGRPLSARARLGAFPREAAAGRFCSTPLRPLSSPDQILNDKNVLRAVSKHGNSGIKWP